MRQLSSVALLVTLCTTSMIVPNLVIPLFVLLLRGTDMTSPHGVPIDLLDHLVIIRTETYGPTEMIKVLNVTLTVCLEN